MTRLLKKWWPRCSRSFPHPQWTSDLSPPSVVAVQWSATLASCESQDTATWSTPMTLSSGTCAPVVRSCRSHLSPAHRDDLSAPQDEQSSDTGIREGCWESDNAPFPLSRECSGHQAWCQPCAPALQTERPGVACQCTINWQNKNVWDINPYNAYRRLFYVFGYVNISINTELVLWKLLGLGRL